MERGEIYGVKTTDIKNTGGKQRHQHQWHQVGKRALGYPECYLESHKILAKGRLLYHSGNQ